MLLRSPGNDEIIRTRSQKRVLRSPGNIQPEPIDRVMDKVFELVVATKSTTKIVAECSALINTHKVSFDVIYANVYLHKRIVGKFR